MRDLRRKGTAVEPLEALEIENIGWASRRRLWPYCNGIGPVVHVVGTHALGKVQHLCQKLIRSDRGGLAALRKKVLAGALGRLKLGEADPELLSAYLGHPAGWRVRAAGVRIV